MSQPGLHITISPPRLFGDAHLVYATYAVAKMENTPLFFSNAPLREGIEKKKLNPGDQIGGITFFIYGDTAIMFSYSPLNPTIGTNDKKSLLPWKKGLASILEIKTILELKKRIPAIRYIALGDELSPAHSRQIQKRGLWVWASRRFTIEKFIKALRWKIAHDGVTNRSVVGKYSTHNRTEKRKKEIEKSIIKRKARWWKRKG